MRTKDFDYFTTWSLIAIMLANVVIQGGRLLHRPQAWLGVFVVCLSLVVCVLGTDAVSYHLEPPETYRKQIMRNHMWMHLVPLISTVILLTNWQFYIGQALTPTSGGAGFLAALSLFGAWVFCPLDTGEIWQRKVVTVYNTQNPYIFLLSGAALGFVGLGLAHQASNHCATTRHKSAPLRTCTG